MNNSKISIIVPVYNVEKYLRRCIDSLIIQTYKNIEIILVDDGSKDDSGNICDLYKKEDKRIKVIHKENGGLSSARNAGLKKITGSFVMFVDSDDYVDKNIIQILYDEIISTNSDMSICSYYSVNNNIKTCPEFSCKKFVVENSNKFYNLYNEYSGVTVSSCMKLFDVKLFNNVFFTEGDIHEDEIIILDILKKAKRIAYNLEPLYYYEMREGSITKKFDIRKLDVLYYMDNRIDYFKKINNKPLIQMTKYKKLHIMLSLVEDFYNYKGQKSDFNNFNKIKKQIKLNSLKCIFYSNLSNRSRINSLIAFVFPLSVYCIIKKRISRG